MSTWIPQLPTLLATILLAAATPPAAAQSAPNLDHGADLTGVWTNVNAPGTAEWAIYTFSQDLPPMTEWALARFNAEQAAARPARRTGRRN